MSDGLSPEAPGLACGTAALVFGPHVWTCHRLVFGDDFADYDVVLGSLRESRDEPGPPSTPGGTPVNVASTGRICCVTRFQSRLPLNGLAATSTSSNSQFSPHTDAGAWDRPCMTACSRM